MLWQNATFHLDPLTTFRCENREWAHVLALPSTLTDKKLGSAKLVHIIQFSNENTSEFHYNYYHIKFDRNQFTIKIANLCNQYDSVVVFILSDNEIKKKKRSMRVMRISYPRTENSKWTKHFSIKRQLASRQAPANETDLIYIESHVAHMLLVRKKKIKVKTRSRSGWKVCEQQAGMVLTRVSKNF